MRFSISRQDARPTVASDAGVMKARISSRRASIREASTRSFTTAVHSTSRHTISNIDPYVTARRARSRHNSEMRSASAVFSVRIAICATTDMASRVILSSSLGGAIRMEARTFSTSPVASSGKRFDERRNGEQGIGRWFIRQGQKCIGALGETLKFSKRRPMHAAGSLENGWVVREGPHFFSNNPGVRLINPLLPAWRSGLLGKSAPSSEGATE